MEPRASALLLDLRTLRRYAWLPLVSVGLAVLVALGIGAVSSSSHEARFRSNVIVDARPPLFGPAVLPGPFDYAQLAMSDGVIADVASARGLTPEQVRPRLNATVRPNSPEIDLKVSGSGALALAQAWRDAFDAAVTGRSPEIERNLTRGYVAQLEQARQRLVAASAAAGTGSDPVAAQEAKAAEENYVTAARLAQSYDVVAATLRAQAFTVTGPHSVSGGVGTPAGRLAAAVAIGLLAGVIGAVALGSVTTRRMAGQAAPDVAPAPLLERERRARTSAQ